MTIFFDMDGVLADYAAAHSDGNDEAPGFFLNLPPVAGAVEAFHRLSAEHDCYILSTAPWSKPHAWMEKRLWVENHLGEAAFKRLILTHNKQLMRGDVLIDDRTANGADGFQGEHIHFGQPGFENWEKVLAYLGSKQHNTANLMDLLFVEIGKKLENCDSQQYPTVCQMRNTPEGLDMVKNYVANLVAQNDGLSIMQAILDTENAFSINSTE